MARGEEEVQAGIRHEGDEQGKNPH